MSYDIIGDVHGEADALEALLKMMGYRLKLGAWQHPDRRAIFVGDFIDRGPGQLRTLELVRNMMLDGHALAVMGNHEFNAIGYFSKHPSGSDSHPRPRSSKNYHQHKAFLLEVAEDSKVHEEWVSWFYDLPLWLDLGDLRIVHACWDVKTIADTSEILGGNKLSRDVIAGAFQKGGRNTFGIDGSRPSGGGQLFHNIEVLLKGIEVDLPEGASFGDKDGISRSSTRTRWWRDPPATFRDGSFLPQDVQGLKLDTPMPASVTPGHDGGSPVFIGHYWMNDCPSIQAPRVACVDYSVAKGGPLVAYRWDGEANLSDSKFIAAH